MKSKNLGLQVAGTIFGLACLVNILRIMIGFTVVLGSHPIPVWMNIIGMFVTGFLCWWMWTLSLQKVQ